MIEPLSSNVNSTPKKPERQADAKPDTAKRTSVDRSSDRVEVSASRGAATDRGEPLPFSNSEEAGSFIAQTGQALVSNPSGAEAAQADLNPDTILALIA
jgi:hypothetical protein